MALTASGAISLSDVNVELGLSATATIAMNDAAVRTLFGVASDAIAMSDGYGKSYNPYFFGTSYPTAYGQQILADSSGNIYQANLNGPGASKSQVLKLSSTGVLQWQRQITSTDLDYPSVNLQGGAVNTSTGDVYAAGINSAGGVNLIHIWKYNSSGTLQWKKQIGDLSNSTYMGGTGSGTLAVDSGGNLVFVVSNIGNVIGAMKVNSSGTTQWQSQITPSGFNNSQADNITVDSSNNVIVSGYIYDSGFSMVLAKFDSSGAVQWVRRGYNADFFGGWGRGVGTDSSGNVYVASSASSNTSILLKYDSSGTYQWATRFALGVTNDHTPYALAVDSSGNCYMFGGGSPSGFWIAKFNSSGTIQWQRSIVKSTNAYMVGVSIGLSTDGSTFYINGRVNDVSESLYAKLPTDGSKTGTFTVNGQTFTYAATSLAVTASNLTLSSLSFSSGGFSRTNNTSSLVDSATSKSFTQTNV